MTLHYHTALQIAKDKGFTRDNILSLDLATKTGWATFKESGNWNLTPTKEEKAKGINEYFKLLDTLSDFIEKHPQIKVIVMEDVLRTGGNAIPNNKLAEYHGIVKAVSVNYYCQPIIEVPYYDIKRYVTGKNNATKKEVMDGVTRKLRRAFASDDEADAIALFYLASRNIN